MTDCSECFVPDCFVDKSHGKMYWITAEKRRNDKWECFVCGSYIDSHGGVVKDVKMCDSMIGGIIANA